jgi:hypothetical protein
MRNVLIVVFALSAAAPAAARPGFYVGLGVGGSAVQGTGVMSGDLTLTSGSATFPAGYLLTTEIDGGLGMLFTMGFNILGYAAIETRLAGQGHDLDDANLREWAAHWHTGVRAYPMWHWQDRLPSYLQPLEPSVFVGWGTTYQGYPLPLTNDEVGWRTWNSWRFGLALEYFVITYFKVSLDYSYVMAPHDLFIYDFSDSINFAAEPTANTGFHQFFVLGTFQFSPAQETVRY